MNAFYEEKALPSHQVAAAECGGDRPRATSRTSDSRCGRNCSDRRNRSCSNFGDAELGVRERVVRELLAVLLEKLCEGRPLAFGAAAAACAKQIESGGNVCDLNAFARLEKHLYFFFDANRKRELPHAVEILHDDVLVGFTQHCIGARIGLHHVGEEKRM